MKKIEAKLIAGGHGREVNIHLEGLTVHVSLYDPRLGSPGYASLALTRVSDAEALMRAAGRALYLLDPATPLRTAADPGPSAGSSATSAGDAAPMGLLAAVRESRLAQVPGSTSVGDVVWAAVRPGGAG